MAELSIGHNIATAAAIQQVITRHTLQGIATQAAIKCVGLVIALQ